MSDANHAKNALWGELRSCMHASTSHTLGRVCEVLAKWPGPLHKEPQLRAYVLAHIPHCRPHPTLPPPLCLALLWMDANVDPLFELLFEIDSQNFEQRPPNALEKSVDVFGDDDSGMIVDIELRPVSLDSLSRAWAWTRQRGQFVGHTDQWCPDKQCTIDLRELEDLVGKIISTKGHFAPLAYFSGLTPPGAFAVLPVIGFWFYETYLELLWVGGPQWRAEEVCSLLESIWYITGEDLNVMASIPMFDNGKFAGFFEEMWRAYMFFRQAWKHSA